MDSLKSLLATVIKSESHSSNSFMWCVAEIANLPKEKPDKLSFFVFIDSTSLARREWIRTSLLFSNKTISSLYSTDDPLHPIRGWNETYQNLFQDEVYDFLASEDYKLLSTAAYFKGTAHNLYLAKSSNRRLTHYDLWRPDLNSSNKILFIAYSQKGAPSNNLNCTKIREVKNFPRKHLTLYNCTSKWK